MVGVYRIKNIVNNKCYYGSSKNIGGRLDRHRRELNNDTHINCVLQRAWNKYGESCFVFEVVEECDVQDLLIVEQSYLDQQPEYNIGKHASGGDNLTNHPNRNEIIKKITKSSRLLVKSLTNGERKERWARPMESNPNWVDGRSISYCSTCGKRISPGADKCIEHVNYERDGENNPFYGKTHTQEIKNKLSEIRQKQGYLGNQNKPIIIDNVTYNSLGEASKSLDIPLTTIRWRVKSKNFSNYKYKT